MTPRGLRNWVILGFAGVGVYLAWRKWGYLLERDKEIVSGDVPDEDATVKGGPPSGAKIKRGQKVVTTAAVSSGGKQTGYAYALTTDTGITLATMPPRKQRYFVAPVNGWFTQRLIQVGNQVFAEVMQEGSGRAWA